MQCLLLDGDLKWSKEMADLHRQSFEIPWSEEDFKGFLSQPFIHFYGALQDNVLASFCILSVIKEEAEIYTLVTGLKNRQKGVATFLFQGILKDLRDRGVERMFLEVDQENKPAIEFYRKMGFAHLSIRPDYYSHPDGSKTSALVMTFNPL